MWRMKEYVYLHLPEPDEYLFLLFWEMCLFYGVSNGSHRIVTIFESLILKNTLKNKVAEVLKNKYQVL